METKVEDYFLPPFSLMEGEKRGGGHFNIYECPKLPHCDKEREKCNNIYPTRPARVVVLS